MNTRERPERGAPEFRWLERGAGERINGLVLTGSSGLFERGFTGGVPRRPDRAGVRRKMVIWGLEDRITPPEVGERFLDLIPTSQLWCLARCGPAPMPERPEPSAAAVSAWLDGTRRRRAASAPAPGGVR